MFQFGQEPEYDARAARLDRAGFGQVSASFIPLLGDAAGVKSLSDSLGRFVAGEPLAKSYTNGPVIKAAPSGSPPAPSV